MPSIRGRTFTRWERRLFHLLAGQPPFAARDTGRPWHPALSTNPRRGWRSLNPNVSEGLARVVERALSKHPEDRYADAGAMLRDLEALLHGQTDRPGDPSAAARLRPASGRPTSSSDGSWNPRRGNSGPW